MSESELLLATASGENVKFWSMPNLELHSIRPFSGMVNCACWSSNNTLLATAVEENNINVASLKGESTADISTGDEQLCLCFSSNSRYLLSGSRGGIAQIWDLKYKTSRKSFKDQRSSIFCTTFNFNDTVIASGSEDGDVLLHSVVSGTASSPLRMPQTQAVRGIQFSNFQKTLLATASDDSAVNLWDANTKQIIKEFKNEHKLPASGICFSPANDMLMCSIGVDKKITFYDVIGKKIVKSINTDSPLTTVDFFHNGATLVVGSSTGKLYLFDLRAGSSPIKSTVADKVAIKTATFQKLVSRTSSKGLARKGSNSSIGSSTSSKSREGANDLKEPKPVSNEEKKNAWVENSSNEANPSKQSASLFSPLRGADAASADAKLEDADIVPMETMRMELLKKGSLLSSIYTERQQNQEQQPSSQPDETPVLNIPKSGEQKSAVSLKTETNHTRPKFSKTSSDSRLSYQGGSPSDRPLATSSVNGHPVVEKEPSAWRESANAPDKPPNGLHEFQIEFIRNMIEDAIEDTRDSIHRGFVHMQGEMLRQFHLQQEEMRKMIEQLSPNQELIEENARLKEEIKRLKTNY